MGESRRLDQVPGKGRYVDVCTAVVIMGILKNISEGVSFVLHPYQQTLLDGFRKGGSKFGEMASIAAGRQTGKSYYKTWLDQAYRNPFNTKYWPHHQRCTWSDVHEIERWCYENCKSRNWRNLGQHFAFKRKEDYAYFILRWS